MRTYQINPRPAELGGGWQLQLLEDGQEMGGGVFPPVQTDDAEFDQAYQDALYEAQIWINLAAC